MEAVALGEVFDWDFGRGSERKGDEEEEDFRGGRDDKARLGLEEFERCSFLCFSESSCDCSSSSEEEA